MGRQAYCSFIYQFISQYSYFIDCSILPSSCTVRCRSLLYGNRLGYLAQPCRSYRFFIYLWQSYLINRKEERNLNCFALTSNCNNFIWLSKFHDRKQISLLLFESYKPFLLRNESYNDISNYFLLSTIILWNESWIESRTHGGSYWVVIINLKINLD